jgi:tetratricopeptide (TPR) repeat protein
MDIQKFFDSNDTNREDHSLDGLKDHNKPILRRRILHRLFQNKQNPIMGTEAHFRHINNYEFNTKDELENFIHGLMNKPINESLDNTDDPKEIASRMVYEAFNSTQKKGQKLIKKALNLDPDNVDAYNYLAIYSDTVEEALHLFEKAMQVGRKTLTKETFEKLKGEFWGVTKTRPYMRAKAGFAECLILLGKEELAIKHYKEMIDLNSNDNQGVRYILAPLLVKEKRYREYEELKKKFPEDIGAHLLYTHACYLYIKEGMSKNAIESLIVAYEFNPLVIPYLIGAKKIPKELPDFIGVGDEDEALYCAAESLNMWRQTKGAIEWIEEFYIEQSFHEYFK